MKIISTSDLHGNMPDNIPFADILTISGDIVPAKYPNANKEEKFIKDQFIPWVTKQAEHICFIPGNHDCYLEKLYNHPSTKEEEKFISELPKNVHYLRDSFVEINGLKIYGTPWTPTFCNWFFMASEEKLKHIYANIPEGVDILLTHTPPKNYCDVVDFQPDHLGSIALLNKIKEVKPIWSISGHLHSGSHTPMKILHDGNDLTKCTNIVNVSLLDEQYEIAYKPFEFEL